MLRDKVSAVKAKAAGFGAKVTAGATAMVLAANTLVFADGDMESVLTSNLTKISDRAITALAVIMAIAALIQGAMSIYDMAQGSKSSNPEQQDKGQKTLVAAIGMAVGAAALLGIKSTINSFISSAMAG